MGRSIEWFPGRLIQMLCALSTPSPAWVLVLGAAGSCLAVHPIQVEVQGEVMQTAKPVGWKLELLETIVYQKLVEEWHLFNRKESFVKCKGRFVI